MKRLLNIVTIPLCACAMVFTVACAGGEEEISTEDQERAADEPEPAGDASDMETGE